MLICMWSSPAAFNSYAVRREQITVRDHARNGAGLCVWRGSLHPNPYVVTVRRR